MPIRAETAIFSGVYSIMCMKQLASSENLGELKKGAFFRSWGNYFFGLKPGIRASFLVPLRILCCMSAYPNLLVLYKILLSLPISNCSAERSMSRLKLIKTRLRSTMSDEWLNGLMILSSEKDILDNLDVDDIINRFANTSPQLSRYLIPS
jgi:hypothetical protein